MSTRGSDLRPCAGGEDIRAMRRPGDADAPVNAAAPSFSNDLRSAFSIRLSANRRENYADDREGHKRIARSGRSGRGARSLGLAVDGEVGRRLWTPEEKRILGRVVLCIPRL